MIRIIAFAGKATGGKSTAAKYIKSLARKDKLPCTIIPFAKPLKQLAKKIGWNGVKDDKGRRILQLLGTEIGRQLIDQDIWVKHWWDAVLKFAKKHNDNCLIIVDDCRFDNEGLKVLDNKGKVVCLLGRASLIGEAETHASEMGLDAELISSYMDNSGSIEDLHAKLDELYKTYVYLGEVK